MADDPKSHLAAADLPEIVRKIRERTPARILVGRAGAAYRTTTQMDLRAAHAAARDAVRTELVLNAAFGRQTVDVNALDLGATRFTNAFGMLAMPVFNAGRTQAINTAAESAQSEATLRYEHGIVRALEVLEATGRPLAEWQAEKQPPILPLAQTFPLVVQAERAELYRRCDARFDAMIADGAIEEARALAALALDPALPAMRAVGLPPLLAYARGEIVFEEAAERAKTSTRNYAKRQTTWINGNFRTWNHYFEKEKERTKRDVTIFLQNVLTPTR